MTYLLFWVLSKLPAFLILAVDIWVCWAMYVSIMALWKAQQENRLTPAMKVLGYPLLFLGYLFDMALNLVVALVIWHAVHEATLTKKLRRIQREDPTGWRARFAQWVCANILNSLDPTGHHC